MRWANLHVDLFYLQILKITNKQTMNKTSYNMRGDLPAINNSDLVAVIIVIRNVFTIMFLKIL